jgi:hypothetical protein
VAERIVLHVIRDSTSGRFGVRQDTDTVATFSQQGDAVQFAREILQGANRGELHVHNEDGTTVSEFTQFETPSSRKGKKAQPSRPSKPKPKAKPAKKARKRSAG